MDSFIYDREHCHERVNGKIRLLIKEKTKGYKYLCQNGNNAYWRHSLKVLQDRLNNSIESSKEKYYNRMASKFKYTKETSKSYWSLLKIFFKQ